MGVKNCDNPSPSPWIRRFSNLLPNVGQILDLAAGAGRHSAWLMKRGHDVLAVDRRTDDLKALGSTLRDSRHGDLEVLEADLEDGSGWPLGERTFEGIVVVNYLHRPLMPDLLESLAPEGVLLYDTFAVGQEAFGRPRNPDFLLKPGELLDVVRGRLAVIAYEHGRIDGENGPAIRQRIAAIRSDAAQPLPSS